jgi:non-homologous end joining protein Ku
MAPTGKGYLKLSLVSAPIAIYSATSHSEKQVAPDRIRKKCPNDQVALHRRNVQVREGAKVCAAPPVCSFRS